MDGDVLPDPFQRKEREVLLGRSNNQAKLQGLTWVKNGKRRISDASTQQHAN